MKNTNSMKRALLQVTYIATIVLLASCTNNQKTEDSKDVAEEHNDAKFDHYAQEKDAQFLVNAAETNLEGIRLGQLAQHKGTTVHVRELGKMMEAAHLKSQRNLIVLAESKSITIPTTPTEDANDAYNKLNEESGIDFDKAYADRVVKAHKNAIDDFEKGSTDCKDADIKNWAHASLPHLRKHLDHSIACQEKSDKM